MRIDMHRFMQYLSEISRLISEALFQKVKPFFDFRNSLIHRYWIMDDETLIQSIKGGIDDFGRFAEEMESYVRSIQK